MFNKKIILLTILTFVSCGLFARDLVRPEQFGAIGDGITDDSHAITQALHDGRSILLSRCYKVKSITIPDGTDIIGLQGSRIQYYEILINSDVSIRSVVFDGGWNTKGVHISGNNVSIQSCRFEKTKGTYDAFGGLTSSIWVGRYEDTTKDHQPKYHNIRIEGCIFDGCSPLELQKGKAVNPSTARFILSYSCDNLLINKCTFKNLIGSVDSDVIQICGNVSNTKELPFYYNGSPWDGPTPPYKGYVYSACRAEVTRCVFYQTCKSSIKVMASDVTIYNNRFQIDNPQNDDLYSVVRIHYAKDVLISGNVINHTSGSLDNVFKLGSAKNICIKNNRISSEDTNYGMRSLLNCTYSSNIVVSNNKCTFNSIYSLLSTEYNESLLIKDNSLVNKGVRLSLYDDIGNHYTYPIPGLKGSVVLSHNKIKTNDQLLRLENKYEYRIN